MVKLIVEHDADFNFVFDYIFEPSEERFNPPLKICIYGREFHSGSLTLKNSRCTSPKDL